MKIRIKTLEEFKKEFGSDDGWRQRVKESFVTHMDYLFGQIISLTEKQLHDYTNLSSKVFFTNDEDCWKISTDMYYIIDDNSPQVFLKTVNNRKYILI